MRRLLKIFPEWNLGRAHLSTEQVHALEQSLANFSVETWEKLKKAVQENSQKRVFSGKHWTSPPCFTLKDQHNFAASLESYRQKGEQAYRQGKVAALTVAGGLGTRLQVQMPKGLLPVTPLKHKPLFQVFAEKLQAMEAKYGVCFHWFIMTSPETHEETCRAFKEQNWYDLNYVHCFPQGVLPAFNQNGETQLKDLCSLVYYPNGHGGLFQALAANHCFEKMQQYGLENLAYFQVDNPLVQIDDPLFMGLHLEKASDFSTKVVRKRQANEKVGVFVSEENRLKLVEYSEMPSSLNEATNDQGELRFQYGNTAIHLFQRSFLEKTSTRELPLHIHNKTGYFWDPRVQNFRETIFKKLEYFVFDALAFAQNPLLFEVDRAEEFSPVKNAHGDDTLELCKQNQIKRWNRWLQNVGALDKNAKTSILCEISPLFADNEADFKDRWQALMQKPKSLENLYLE